MSRHELLELLVRFAEHYKDAQRVLKWKVGKHDEVLVTYKGSALCAISDRDGLLCTHKLVHNMLPDRERALLGMGD